MHAQAYIVWSIILNQKKTLSKANNISRSSTFLCRSKRQTFNDMKEKALISLLPTKKKTLSSSEPPICEACVRREKPPLLPSSPLSSFSTFSSLFFSFSSSFFFLSLLLREDGRQINHCLFSFALHVALHSPPYPEIHHKQPPASPSTSTCGLRVPSPPASQDFC